MMKKIFGWFGKKKNPRMDSSEMMKNLIHKLAVTEERELSCDDVHKILDQFTEMELRGEDVALLMPLVQRHLDLCPDCREEHEVLIRALEFEKRMDE
jgi:hypothetical protein